MPFISTCRYHPPFWLGGGTARTLLPRILRRVLAPDLVLERIPTPDDDSLNLDWRAARPSVWRCGYTVSKGGRVVVFSAAEHLS